MPNTAVYPNGRQDTVPFRTRKCDRHRRRILHVVGTIIILRPQPPNFGGRYDDQRTETYQCVDGWSERGIVPP